MRTTRKYAFKIMTIYTQLLCFFLLVNASQENTKKKPDVFANKVNLSDNYIVEWTVNETSIEFKVNVTVDEKGWIFLGFMPVPKNTSANPERPEKLHDSRGDFVVTWPSSASERSRTILDLNTIKTPGVLQKDENSTQMDYHVNVQQVAKNTSHRSILLISRKLDTGDSQDVIITDQPMWMFAAYGNSDVYLKDLSDIINNIGDLMVKKVILVKSNGKDDNKTPWHKMLREQMEKHWITVVLAVSGVLTVVITGTVYCCFRKGKNEFKNKKVKMTFYKEDEDDEARVAFLHSRT